jgi:hypothetical protein
MSPESLGLPSHLLTGLTCAAQIFDARIIRYALIGGVATCYRSLPRSTEDINFLLQVPQIALPGLLEEFRKQPFVFDFYATIREWNQDHVATLYYHEVRVTWLKPILSCHQHVLDTAGMVQWLGSPLRMASAEGLILLKLLEFGLQDQWDIRSLLAAHSGKLDLEWIRREWLTVAESHDPRIERFEEMVNRYYLSSAPPTTG